MRFRASAIGAQPQDRSASRRPATRSHARCNIRARGRRPKVRLTNCNDEQPRKRQQYGAVRQGGIGALHRRGIAREVRFALAFLERREERPQAAAFEPLDDCACLLRPTARDKRSSAICRRRHSSGATSCNTNRRSRWARALPQRLRACGSRGPLPPPRASSAERALRGCPAVALRGCRTERAWRRAPGTMTRDPGPNAERRWPG